VYSSKTSDTAASTLIRCSAPTEHLASRKKDSPSQPLRAEDVRLGRTDVLAHFSCKASSSASAGRRRVEARALAVQLGRPDPSLPEPWIGSHRPPRMRTLRHPRRTPIPMSMTTLTHEAAETVSMDSRDFAEDS